MAKGGVSFKQRLQEWRARLRWPPGARFAFVWHAAGALIGFVFAALLLLFDPFDLDRGISDRGREIFYKVASFAYPERRSPKTLVVQLDDAFLQEEGRSWPVSYGVHAAAIDLLASRRPAAIFVDFVFLDARDDPELDLFLTTLERVSETTPLYLAAAPSSAAAAPARSEIVDLVARNPGIKFVSVVAGERLGAAPAYPTAHDQDGLLPAAVQIYADLCETPGACEIYRAPNDMEIWWAAPRLSDFNCRGSYADICERLPDGPLVRTYSLGTGAFSGLLPTEWEPIDPIPVPYAPTVGLSDLFNGASVQRLRDQIPRSVVFYGGNVSFVGDEEVSPVHGPLSGVHAHAMAYDNLEALEGAFIQARPPFGWGFKAHTIALCGVLAITGLLVRLFVTLREPRRRWRPHKRAAYFGALDGLAFLAAAIIIAIVEFKVGRIGPTSWAPVLAAAAAGDILSARPMTGALVVRLLGRSRTAAAERAAPR